MEFQCCCFFFFFFFFSSSSRPTSPCMVLLYVVNRTGVRTCSAACEARLHRLAS